LADEEDDAPHAPERASPHHRIARRKMQAHRGLEGAQSFR